MTLAAPPKPPTPRDVEARPEFNPLEALIEEARQRARRRRRRRWGAILAFVAIAGVFTLVLTERGGNASGGATRGERVPLVPTRVKMHNGSLAIMDIEKPFKRYTGWYPFSRIRTDGSLAPLVRCPVHRADWCGDAESIDWSPDGTHLAYSITSFGNANPSNGLHVVDLPMGQDTMLLGCCGDWFDIDWSPDGARLAYVTRDRIYGQDEIHIVDATRRGSEEAAQRHLVWGSRPSWSPDGQWIAFSRARDGRHSVYVVRPGGEDEHLLVARGSRPAWSPDGLTIAYRAGCRILMAAPDGTDVTPRRLRRCIRFGGSVLRRIGPPVWSPDGRKLAFSVPGTDLLFGSARHGTFVIDTDGTNLRRVSARSQGMNLGQARPAWQPVR